MKISALFATIALAQDERAMSLDKKIENAQTKCGVFMEKALVCEPPSEKIGKYTFRLDKVSFISVQFCWNWIFWCQIFQNCIRRFFSMPSITWKLANATQWWKVDTDKGDTDEEEKLWTSSMLNSMLSWLKSPKTTMMLSQVRLDFDRKMTISQKMICIVK